MADVYTGTGNVTTTISAQYKQAWLSFLTPDFYYVGFGKRGGDMDVSMNSGKTVQWDRPDLLPVATTPIPEYETPAPLSRFSSTPLTATIDWYGDHIMHADRAVKIALNKSILSKMREVQVQQYKNTMDQLCRDVLAAGGNHLYANDDGTPTLAEVNTLVTKADFDYVAEQLRTADVPFITKRVNPSQLVGTKGIDPCYIAICHTELESTIIAACNTTLAEFVPVTEYAAPGTAMPGEFGKYKHIRFISTSNGKKRASYGGTGTACRETNSTNADVYTISIFGEGAYGETKLGGKGFEYIVKAPGDGGSEDPHNQRGSAAWHQATVFTVLQTARLWNIHTGAAPLS